MSITQYTRVAAVWFALACMQTTIAGEKAPATRVQDEEPTRLNIQNNTDFSLTVTVDAGAPTSLPPGAARTLPLDHNGFAVQPPINSGGKIEKVTLRKKDPQASPDCQADQCMVIEGKVQK